MQQTKSLLKYYIFKNENYFEKKNFSIIYDCRSTYTNSNSNGWGKNVKSEEIINVELQLINSLNSLDKKYFIDEEEQIVIYNYIHENGIEAIDKLMTKTASEMKNSVNTEKTMNTYEFYITEDGIDENGEVNINQIHPTSTSKYYSKDQYHLEEFNRGWRIEYIALLGLTMNVSNGRFTSVSRSTFDCVAMSTAGSYSSPRSSFHINNDGTSCSHNVNYTIEFGFDIPILDNYGFPIKYSKPAHDYLIAYY